MGGGKGLGRAAQPLLPYLPNTESFIELPSSSAWLD